MMIVYLILFLLCSLQCQYSYSAPLHEEWLLWKRHHNKNYPHMEEERKRHDVWLENKKYIEEHNKQAHIHGFTLKMNHLGDLVMPMNDK